jgi:hypothetical protein
MQITRGFYACQRNLFHRNNVTILLKRVKGERRQYVKRPIKGIIKNEFFYYSVIMKIRVKILDIIIIFAVAGLTFFAAYMAYMKPKGNAQVLIQGQGEEWVYPIEADATVVVTGPIGDTTVRIRGSCAWVESSPCDNKTCMATGSISRQGEWAACLPNNILVIVNGSEDDVDGISW